MDNFDSLIGQKLDVYQLQEKVGQSGFSSVYRAYQANLDRTVAVKVLSPDRAVSPNFTERFKHEALSIAKLNHPNLLEVYDFGLQDDLHYIVMRYVHGSVTLSDLMGREFSADRLIEFVMQIADALSYVHRQGVIHRNIKPENILIDDRFALLADFSLVQDSGKTDFGTPAYMSPEQVLGRVLDERTDIYSLGAVLFQILTRTIPHTASTPKEILNKRANDPAPSVLALNPGVDPALAQVVERALAKEPQDRYQSVAEFLQALNGTQRRNLRRRSGTSSGILQQLPKIVGFLGGVVGLVALFVVWSINRDANSGDDVIFRSDPSPVAALAAADVTSTPTEPLAKATSTATNVVVAPTETNTSTATPTSAVTATPTRFPSSTPTIAPPTVTATPNDDSQPDSAITTTLTPSPSVPVASPTATEVSNTPTPTETATSTPSPSPTPSPTATSTSTTPPTATRTPTASSTPTPTLTPTNTATANVPAATNTPSTPRGELLLLEPVPPNNGTRGITKFVWRWDGAISNNQGFEVRIWRPGAPPYGAHDAVADNLESRIIDMGNDTYSLEINITGAAGVQNQSGEYFWTVSLIDVSPSYRDLGIQAVPSRLRLDVGGDDGGGGGGDDGPPPGTFG